MSVDFLFNAGPHRFSSLGRRNLGDLFCSPSSYLEFEAEGRTLIIGGGIQGGYLLGKKPVPEGYHHIAIWGGGLSSKPERPLFGKIEGVDSWTTRDRDCVEDDANWLPCVSCLHPMLSDPKVVSSDGVGLLYVNADPVIYSMSSLLKSKRLADTQGLRFCTNRAPVEVLFEKWHDCEFVITNSYHGAYWSLLAGKKVSVLGYNYKFESLGFMFGIDLPVINFKKNEPRSLLAATHSAVNMGRRSSLPDANKTLDRFRARQLMFAQNLIKKRVLIAFSIKERQVFDNGGKARASELRALGEEYLAYGVRRLLSRSSVC